MMTVMAGGRSGCPTRGEVLEAQETGHFLAAVRDLQVRVRIGPMFPWS